MGTLISSLGAHTPELTTTSPITEICTLHTRVPRDQAISRQTKPLGEAYIPAPGFQGIRWGFQLENPTVLYWFTKWASLDAPKSLVKTPAYTSLIDQVLKFATPSLLRTGAVVPDAPVIEWCTIHIGHDTVREEWEKGVDALREVLENTAADKGYRGLGAGWSLESDREFIVMIGWETKEAHTSWKAGLDADLAEKGMVLFRKGAKSVKIVHIKIEGEVTEVANGNKDEESAEQAEIEGGPAITA